MLALLLSQHVEDQVSKVNHSSVSYFSFLPSLPQPSSLFPSLSLLITLSPPGIV